ncbi:hypothetical protein [Thalassotalea litorea]|uniref:hypothetical protein n=1 Tax=Thalassotalea litorea TaxID=2020715 RepID=UPI0037358CAA
MKSMFSKTLSLFQQSAYPLHHTYVQMLERYTTTSEKYLVWQDIMEVSALMGEQYQQFIQLFDAGNLNDFFYKGLSIKVAVKKKKALTGSESIDGVDNAAIEKIIAKYTNLFEHDAECLRQQKEAEKQAEEARRLQLTKERNARMRQEQEARRQQYEKEFVDFPDWDINRIKRGSRAAKILQRLQRQEISEQDFLWLKDKGFENEMINDAFYIQRAKKHLSHWKNARKPWSFVNAIADFRKGNQVREVLPEVKKQLPFSFSNGNKKLQSALYTTSGGAYRDIRDYNTAIDFGEKAHSLTPDNFRPCTLLGAAHILNHDTAVGYAWYQKAIERGFEEERVDDELRSIYIRSDASNKKRLKADLKQQGYSARWLN